MLWLRLSSLSSQRQWASDPSGLLSNPLFKVSADKPGTYTVNYKLVNLEDSSTICEASESIEITE